MPPGPRPAGPPQGAPHLNTPHRCNRGGAGIVISPPSGGEICSGRNRGGAGVISPPSGGEICFGHNRGGGGIVISPPSGGEICFGHNRGGGGIEILSVGAGLAPSRFEGAETLFTGGASPSPTYPVMVPLAATSRTS